MFWDYSKFKFNLGGRINLLYCFFWGIAAVMWMRYGYPLVLELIEAVWLFGLPEDKIQIVVPVSYTHLDGAEIFEEISEKGA